MYLRHLHVQNVKLLRDVKIDFVGADGQPRMWTVIVGENRSCKTTLLQTIAAAASGRDRAVHLTTDVVSSWPDLRRPKAHLSIDAELGYNDAGVPPHWRTHLHLEPGRSIFEGDDYLDDQDIDDIRTIPGELFGPTRGGIVAGYGIRRTLRDVGTADRRRTKDPYLDRLKPLFGEDVIGTSFIELLDDSLARSFARILQSVLVQGELLPHITSLELRGRGDIRSTKDLIGAQLFEMDIRDDQGERIRVPAAWLSQGYQSTIAWLADVVGQILLEAEEPIEAAAMEGCVLVDEIDMYLHPTWQVRLIPALKQVFPKLQFIATTHSPMILPALTADEVWLLSHDAEGSVIATVADRSPALLTGSELLETFFEIHKLYPSDLGEKASTYGRLATDPTRTEEEDVHMKSLRQELAASGVEFDWEPVPREGTE
jgi:hypothetical protein